MSNMTNHQITDIYPRIKALLEEKYGIIKSDIVRGSIEEDNPQKISEEELSILCTDTDV